MKIADGMMDRNSLSNGRLKSKSTVFIASRPPAISEDDIVARMCCWQMRMAKSWYQGVVSV